MSGQGSSFGERIRQLREGLGWTRRDLAARVRLSVTYLEKVERGYSPPPAPATIGDLARVLRADGDELFCLAGRVAPDVLALLHARPLLVQLVRVGSDWDEGRLCAFLAENGVTEGRLALRAAGRFGDGGAERRCYRRGISTALRRHVFALEGNECVYCSSRAVLEVDHVYPYSEGGTDEPENLVACCTRCNNKKKARLHPFPMVFGRFRGQLEE